MFTRCELNELLIDALTELLIKISQELDTVSPSTTKHESLLAQVERVTGELRALRALPAPAYTLTYTPSACLHDQLISDTAGLHCQRCGHTFALNTLLTNCS